MADLIKADLNERASVSGNETQNFMEDLPKMEIKLLKAWNYGGKDYAISDILNISDTEFATKMIADGIAEQYDEAAAAQQLVIQQKAAPAPAPEVPAAKAVGGAVVMGADPLDKDPKTGFKTYGEFAKAVSNHFTEKGTDARLKAAGLNETLGSEGGFLIPVEFRQELLQKATSGSQLFGRTRQIPMQTNSVSIPFVAETSRADGSRQGGLTGYWRGEGVQLTGSKPDFGKVTLTLDKLTILIYGTNELLEDSPMSMEPLLMDMAANEIAFKLDDGIMNGTGAGMPQGIMNCPALVTVSKEVGQLADTIQVENLVNMWSRLHPGSKGNAVWFINSDVTPQLYTMGIAVGMGGSPVYLPAGSLAGSPYGTLFGRPVVEIEQCDTLGDKGDIVLADVGQYLFGMKSGGIKTDMSIHLRFDYDESAFRYIFRGDGRSWWPSALTPKNSTNTLSPFVTLEARA